MRLESEWHLFPQSINDLQFHNWIFHRNLYISHGDNSEVKGTHKIILNYSLDLDSKQFQKMSHWCVVIEKHLKAIFYIFRVWQGRQGATTGEKYKVT